MASDREQWSDSEVDILLKYAGSTSSKTTLFRKLRRLNPARTYDSMKAKLRQISMSGVQIDRPDLMDGMRVGYLDIETTNLNADFGYIITWMIKKAGKKVYDWASLTRDDVLDYTMDQRVVLELLTALEKYDVVYTHYGSDRRFDVPYIRSRAYAWGLEEYLPVVDNVFLMDTYPISRNRLKIHSNRLDSIADLLGVSIKKTPLSGMVWRYAALGHPDAVRLVLHHNKRDVQILEEIHKRLKIIERVSYVSM